MNSDDNLEKKINELFDDEPINVDELLDSNLNSNSNFNFKDSLNDELINKKDEINSAQLNNKITDKSNDLIDNDEVNLKDLKNSDDKTIKQKKSSNFDKYKLTNFLKQKMVISFLTLIIIIVFFIIFYNQKMDISCHYEAKDNGYQINDKYVIRKKGNKIINVIGTYKFKALNDEWKNQIKYIKDEKNAVIVNSNGYSGFTFTYEETIDTFTLNSYLDFLKFDYKQIEKVNQDKKPLNYFKIYKKLNYKKLIKELEKNGFTCKNVKDKE